MPNLKRQMSEPHPVSESRPFDVTHRAVLAIALPMTIAYLSTPLLGIVDTAVIGQLGRADLLGGIAVGAVVFDFLFTTFNFLRMGTTGQAAQAYGAGDRIGLNAVLYRSALIALAAGLAMIVLSAPILALAIGLMGASAAVNTAVSDYFSIRILAAPAGLLNYVLLGWFLGQGQARKALILQLLLNISNIAFSAYFVLVLDMGVAGVAWGTVLSQAITLVAGAALAYAALAGDLTFPTAVVFARDRLLRTFALNRDIMIRSFSLLVTFALFTSAGARQGDVVLAANAVLMNFFMLASFFLDGTATAAEQLAGRAIGANYRPAFVKAVRLSCGWGLAIAAVLSLVLYGAGPVLIDLITTSPEVRETARTYLIWAALTPLFGVMAFQLDGVFIGATWSDDMRNMMLVSLVAYVVVWALATPVLGNHGLWLALATFLAVRGATLALRYPVRLARSFSSA